MDKEKIKDETKSFVISLVVFSLILKIVFYKEGIMNIAMITSGIYWNFIIPGYIIGYSFLREKDFLERMVIGAIIGTAVVGIASYYLGLLGIHIRYHSAIIPVVIITAGLASSFLAMSPKK